MHVSRVHCPSLRFSPIFLSAKGAARIVPSEQPEAHAAKESRFTRLRNPCISFRRSFSDSASARSGPCWRSFLSLAEFLAVSSSTGSIISSISREILSAVQPMMSSVFVVAVTTPSSFRFNRCTWPGPSDRPRRRASGWWRRSGVPGEVFQQGGDDAALPGRVQVVLDFVDQ